MTPSQRHVLKEVSAQTGIPVERIVSRDRTQYVVAARHQVMKRLYDMGCYSLAQIGRVVGKDHSTVAHAVGRLNNKKPSRRGWHRPLIGHLHCLGCRHCRIAPAEPVPEPPKPHRRARHAVKRLLIPYAGFDPDEYRPKRWSS